MSFADDLRRWAALELWRAEGIVGELLQRILRGDDTGGLLPIPRQGLSGEVRVAYPRLLELQQRFGWFYATDYATATSYVIAYNAATNTWDCEVTTDSFGNAHWHNADMSIRLSWEQGTATLSAPKWFKNPSGYRSASNGKTALYGNGDLIATLSDSILGAAAVGGWIVLAVGSGVDDWGFAGWKYTEFIAQQFTLSEGEITLSGGGWTLLATQTNYPPRQQWRFSPNGLKAANICWYKTDSIEYEAVFEAAITAGSPPTVVVGSAENESRTRWHGTITSTGAGEDYLGESWSWNNDDWSEWKELCDGNDCDGFYYGYQNWDIYRDNGYEYNYEYSNEVAWRWDVNTSRPVTVDYSSVGVRHLFTLDTTYLATNKFTAEWNASYGQIDAGFYTIRWETNCTGSSADGIGDGTRTITDWDQMTWEAVHEADISLSVMLCDNGQPILTICTIDESGDTTYVRAGYNGWWQSAGERTYIDVGSINYLPFTLPECAPQGGNYWYGVLQYTIDTTETESDASYIDAVNIHHPTDSDHITPTSSTAYDVDVQNEATYNRLIRKLIHADAALGIAVAYELKGYVAHPLSSIWDPVKNRTDDLATPAYEEGHMTTVDSTDINSAAADPDVSTYTIDEINDSPYSGAMTGPDELSALVQSETIKAGSVAGGGGVGLVAFRVTYDSGYEERAFVLPYMTEPCAVLTPVETDLRQVSN